MLYPYANRTAKHLQAIYDKAYAESSRLCDAMIAAGRGQERPSETRTKSDALSLRCNANADALRSLREEMARRERFHGTLRPIPDNYRQSFLAKAA